MMPRYVAFLRGVSPMNCRMTDLRTAFEAAGFDDVRTVISSGNVVFSTRSASRRAIERRADMAMESGMGRTFASFVRPAEDLAALVAGDPFAEFALPASFKPVVTFLRHEADREIDLPVEGDGARILRVTGTEVFTAYEPSPRGPGFMGLLERTFGRDITTRTLATVRKCAEA